MTRHTLLDRVLHRLALQSPAFRKFCFERECERNDFASNPGRENVFVAGLARAGSTALLAALYDSGAFAATTYAAMPFVLSPSLARRLARLPRTAVPLAERAHGDGIAVGLDSPEALDGVFWSTFFASEGDRLRPRQVPPATLRRYAMFVENLLLDAGASRYLSKMNQGIDKLESLAGYFERSIFLLPFRDPLQQAASLARQHRNFGRLSGYEARYFGWLGHHEFGALHRPFGVDDAPPGPAPAGLNYWLRQWREVYACLSRIAGLYPNLLPVCYERMAQSQSFWQDLSQRLGADISGAGFVDRNRIDAAPADAIDAALLRECRSLYARLSEQGASGPCR